MCLTPIGEVVNERAKHQWHGWQELVSEIHVRPEYAPGLEHIEAYSHLVVLYALDNAGKVSLLVTPQGKSSSPRVGIFASRCPWRPSPVGVTTCGLLERRGNILVVRGLDTIDKTPVFDIKPFWWEYDGVEKEAYRRPEWVEQLEF